MSRCRWCADAVLAGGIFVVVFFYRFNTLGSSLGGFGNDQFGYLARARQIQAGEVPFRDFNDPGWFLTDYASAAAQWLGGYNLRSEALLTLGMLSLGAALTFLLARRAATSILAAVAGVLFLLAVDPRPYNYPKIVLYATGLILAWAYADRPGPGRLAALGIVTGIAALFRHDHIIYLGALAFLTVALVHRDSFRAAARATAGLVAATALVVTPFLIFLTLNGGIGEYFRTAWVYVARDAERTSFSLPRLSLDQLDTAQNATAFLYYVLVALPVVAAGVLAVLRRSIHSARVLTSLAHIVPFLVLAAALNIAFLSRGSTMIRIGDVGVTGAITLAWLASALFGGDARLLIANGVARAFIRGAAALVLVGAFWSANSMWQIGRHIEEAGLLDGPGQVLGIAAGRWRYLGTHPPALTHAPDHADVLRIAAYLHECTAPTDRVFVLGEYPELYYFSDRRFAGGHAWLLPGYYSDDPDEARIVSRLAGARVPIVVTEGRMFYDEQYKPDFERIDAYLRREYIEAGDVEREDGRPLRVLVRADLEPVRRYEPLDLPCFAGAR